MNPIVLHEIGILGLVALGGISIAYLAGIRRPILLVLAGFGASVSMRVLSAFSMWSLGFFQYTTESWIVLSLVAIVAAALRAFRDWRIFLIPTLIFAVLSSLALSAKFVWGIGERQHSDSGSIISLALISLQREADDLITLGERPKRGMAYPLMLALGDEGSIFASFTPMVFLVTIVGILWLGRALTGAISQRVFIAVALLLGAFSLSVPMFRAGAFYLNGHTLLGFGLLLMVIGAVIGAHSLGTETQAYFLMVIGGVVGVTARIEGIAFVLVVFAAVLSQSWWTSSGNSRIGLASTMLIPAFSLWWWLEVVRSTVTEDLGLSVLWLSLGSIVLSIVAVWSGLDRFRRFIFPAVALLILGLLAREVLTSNDPVGLLLAQWPNLVMGKGGWGTAAHVFVGSTILMGFTTRSPQYRALLAQSILFIAVVFVTKTLDGGFGRPGFDDSVNRMYLQIMPLVAVTALVGFSELFSSFAQKARISWLR